MHQGCQVPFQISRGNVEFLSRHFSEKGPHLAMMGESRGFSRVVAGFLSYDGDLREPPMLAQGTPISIRAAMGSWGLLSSHYKANTPYKDLCPETPCSSPMATRISVLHSNFSQGVRPCFEWKQRTPLSSRVVMGISWRT